MGIKYFLNGKGGHDPGGNTFLAEKNVNPQRKII